MNAGKPMKLYFAHDMTLSFTLSVSRGYVWKLYGIKIGQVFFGFVTRSIARVHNEREARWSLVDNEEPRS